MKPNILIVSEDQVLSQTRALLLLDWEVATTSPSDAAEVIRNRTFDLLIFCQSVSDASAQQLLAQAVRLHPGIKCLAISGDEGRQLPVATYVVQLNNPAGLQEAVVALLRTR